MPLLGWLTLSYPAQPAMRQGPGRRRPSHTSLIDGRLDEDVWQDEPRTVSPTP